jgi:hypothetical protein
MTTFGYSFFTPRWLFVIAQATPADVVGDPLVVDESIPALSIREISSASGSAAGTALAVTECCVKQS